jgi:hypothetical protein
VEITAASSRPACRIFLRSSANTPNSQAAERLRLELD